MLPCCLYRRDSSSFSVIKYLWFKEVLTFTIYHTIMNITANSQPNSKSHYWFILIGLYTISIIVGFVGFQHYFKINQEDYTIFRSIYRSLALFALEGGDLSGIIPWELHIARISAPLTSISTLIIALFGIFGEQWNRFKISRKRDHIVIIGFGSKGKYIMDEGLKRGNKIVIIENDPLNANLGYINRPKCRLLKADATHITTLKKAKISRAKSVFLLMGDDTKQINTCLLIHEIIKESKRGKSEPLYCVLHLQKQEFITTLRNHKLLHDIDDAFILKIFNVYENSARELFEEYPPDGMGITLHSENYVQIIIFGFGQAGEALALQAALTGHYINSKKTQVLIIDRLAKEKVPDFLERYPAYTDHCDLKYLALEANSPQLFQHLEEYLEDPQALTTMVLCFDNHTQNMLLGLQLESMKLDETDKSLQIYIRTHDDESFASFPQNIKPYGLASKVCSREVVIDGDLDRKAMAFHEHYLKKRKNVPGFGTKESDVSWENLSQEYKDSNRKAADHMGVKMRGIGCEIVCKDDSRPSATFSEEEIEKLSELEHKRWNAERSLAGWTYSKLRNDKIRKTPDLTSWDNLSIETREYDVNAVMSIPEVLATVGLKVVRL